MTDQYNDNWNDFPIHHHRDAPSVEDLNPSRNFQNQTSLACSRPHIQQLLTNS